MSQRLEGYLRRAHRALATARIDLDAGDSNASANRSYYAAFYAVTAALLSQDIEAKTHAGLHTQFALTFVKPGVLPPALSTQLSHVERLRCFADYFETDVPEAMAEEAIAMADGPAVGRISAA
ncbi:MAG: HEPN domain-containing protein [Nitrococcus sp.]|nr:HEPN domain-containing protein [Nitrococcus sp.]